MPAAATFFEQLPDLGALTGLRDQVGDGLGGLLNGLPADPSDLLGQLPQALDLAGGAIPENPSDLTAGFTNLLNQAGELIPAGSVTELQSLIAAMSSVRQFIGEHPVGQLIGSGGNLKQIGEALREQWDQLGVRDDFASNVQGLIGNVLPVESLQTFSEFISAVQRLESGAPGDAAELLSFISRHFFGLPANLLAGPKSAIDSFLNPIQVFVTGLSPEAVEAPRDRLAGALTSVAGRLSSMAPDDAAAYQEALDALTAARADLVAVQGAVNSAVSAAESAVAGLNVDQLRTQLEAALRAVPPLDARQVEDVRAVLLEFVDGLVGQVESLDPSQAVTRIQQMASELDSSLQELGLEAARESVLDMFRQISSQLGNAEQLVEPVKEALRGVFQSIQGAVSDAGIEQLQPRIEQIFEDIRGAIEGLDLNQIVQLLDDSLRGLIDVVDGIPVESLSEALTEAMEQVQAAVADLAATAQTAVEQVNGALSSIGQIDLGPAVQPVIEEINQMKTSLRAIDPDRLSDAEKAAFVAATAILQAIDFEEVITSPLLSLYDEISQPIVSALEEVLGKLTAVVDSALAFDPDGMLEPLLKPYQELQKGLDRLQAEQLIQPLQEALQQLVSTLEQQIKPEALLQPLQEGYDRLMEGFDKLSPEQLRAPLDEIYGAIEELVEKIDLTPLFDQLEQLEEELFAEFKDAVTGAVADLNLPEPLSGFLTRMTALVDLLSPATVRDPAAALDSLGATVAGDFRPGDMLEPLDRLYQRLAAAVESLPQDRLLAVFSNLGADLGRAVDLIDPDNLSAAIGERASQAVDGLGSFSPSALIGRLSSGHGALQSAFASIDAAQVPAPLRPTHQQIGLLITQLEPNLALGSLEGRFTAARGQFAALTGGADFSALADLVEPLRNALTPLIPDFLRGEITLDAIRDGLQALSPARLAEDINAAFDRLVAAAAGLQAAVQPEVVNLLNTVKKHLLIFDPAGWKDVFEQIKADLLSVFESLNPAFLVDELQELFDRLKGVLDTFNPRIIIEGVSASFQAALDLVRNLDLSPLTQRLNQLLTMLKSKLRFLDPERLKELLSGVFNEVRRLVEALDVKRLLETFKKALDDFRKELEQTLRQVGSAFNSFKQELVRISSRIGLPLGDLGGLAGSLPF